MRRRVAEQEVSAAVRLDGGTGAALLARMASAGGGVVMSFFILLGISKAQRTSIEEPPPPIEDLRALAIEAPPPPPPLTAAFEPPLPTALEIDPEDSDEGIKIAAVIRPPEMAVPSVPELSFALDIDAYKPRGEGAGTDTRRVFQPSEVDQRPVAIYRKTPKVSRLLIESVDNPRVTLLFVVNVDGGVENMHVLYAPSEEFGDVIVEAVSEWRFRAAIRAGRKVRCLVQLPIFVRPPSTSPFSVY